MADTYAPYDPTLDPSSPDYAPAKDTSAAASDYLKVPAAATLGLGADAASDVRAAGDASNSPGVAALGDFFRTVLKAGQQGVAGTESEGAQQQLAASLTSPEFWAHPVSAAALKTLDMAPSVAAAVIPAVLTDGGTALFSTAAVGAAQGAGQSASDVYDQTDSRSDSDLQQHVPYYAGLRSMGVSEDAARSQLNTKLMGLKPLLNAAATAGAMVLGPAGRVAGLIPEEAGAGILTRAAVGAGEGAAGGAIMGGAAEATHEQTQIDLDQRTQLDPGLIAAATFDAAATQGLMGAVGGAFTHGERAQPDLRTTTKSVVAPDVETIDSRSPDAGQTAALAATSDMPPVPASPNLDSAPKVTDAGNPPSAPGDLGQATPQVAASDVPTRPPSPVSAPEGSITIRKADLMSPDGTVDMRAAGQKVSQQVGQALADGRTVTLHTEGKEIPIVGLNANGQMADAEGKGWGTVGSVMMSKVGNDDRIEISGPKVDDAGKTVPEAPETLKAQQDQLVAGQRQAMLFPKGGDTPLPAPDGMKSVRLAEGTVHFNPDLLKYKDVIAAKTAGRLNDILGLGDYSKADIAPKVSAGEPPIAVTERQPDGTEVKAAAGVPSTAPDQVASLEAAKTPGNTVQVEKPEQVLAQRQATAEPPTPAIHTPDENLNALPADKVAEISQRLESIWRVAEQQEAAGNPIKGGIEAFIARKRDELTAQAKAEAGIKEPGASTPRARATVKNEGKHYTEDELAARAKNNATANDVVDAYKPAENESVDQFKDRLTGMMTESGAKGVEIPTKIKDITNKDMEHNSAVTLLSEAKKLAARKYVGPKEMAEFKGKEALLRSGVEADRRAVLEQRRAEGDAAWARSRERQLENTRDPEAEIAAERERLEAVPDDGQGSPGEVEAPENEEASEEPRAQTPPEQDRPAIALKGNEGQGVKDRAADVQSGKIKVETKKRPTLRRIGGDDATSPGQEAYDRLAQTTLHPIETRTLRGYVGDPPKAGGDSAVNQILSPYITHRLKEFIGNTKVSILPHEEMEHVVPNSNGFYVHSNNGGRIYLHEDLASNPRAMQAVLLHEGMHAAVDRAIEENPQIKQTIQMVMKEALAYVRSQPDMRLDTIAYGFTDEHEFMSEAMSNPDFQDMLSKAKASKELTSRLQLNSPLTLRDMIVHLIRKVLGISNNPNDFRLIEAALRTSNKLMAAAANRDLGPPTVIRPVLRAHMKVGDFSPAGDQAHADEINGMFHSTMAEAVNRTAANGAAAAKDFVAKVTDPARLYSATIEKAQGAGGVARKILNAVTTNDQYRQQIEKLLPMAKQIFDANEKTGVYANTLKTEGVDLTGLLMRAQKENPKLFEKFASLVQDQTMHGVDASAAIGEGRNAHLRLPQSIEAKLAKGESIDDVAHEAAMGTWQAREQHPALAARYKEIIRSDPEYAPLQKHLFDYYEKSQSAIVRDQIERILQTYGYKGTDEERGAAATSIYKGKLNDVTREAISSKLEGDGENALKQIEATKALRVVDGPYAPQMRRGEHAVIGEYKVAEPAKGTKIDPSTWEFKDRQDAHDFAVKSGLHAEPKVVYYDTATGKRVKSKSDAISQVGEPEQRFQIRLQRQHLEFHEKLADAKASMEELKKSGLFDKLGLEERRHIESEQSQFSDRGVESLLRSLSQQKAYRDATDAERDALRSTIRETGVRSMSDNRVQSRRLPRRYVQGASDDIARNLYDYSNSQANYRAQMKFRQEKDDGLKAMWDHVAANRYSPDNEARSAAANEVERRMRAPDPNQFSGAYTDWTRRLSTWSYIDRMARPSHLILHQTHLPMITAPYMAGRHGLMSAFGATLKSWKELTGFYKTGGKDFAESMVNALHKGSNYADVAKEAFKNAPDGKRLAELFNQGTELGWIHPSAGLEVHKYLPSKELGGIVGGLDHGLSKIDTVFRHLTNATEAVNRMAGATAAYRLEFAKLTRAGKPEAEAHTAAMEYARKVITDTQGLFSSTNASPLFKNKVLKPFLQFKQFPQMMYHLLSKLAVTALKGETREAKVEALGSLGAILGMHMMMAGVLQGLPLEPFKLLGLISKGIGLTDGDWSDVEQAVTRKLNDTFGKEAGNVLTHGLGAQMGVDVHHRLGLNSFITYGMPDQLDSKSVSEFLMNAIVGAPGGMVTDAVKGTHKMLTGDIEGGALQAMPLQAFRDIHNAIAPAPNKYDYQATGADRVKSLLGFTPAQKAYDAEKKEAVYNAVQNYDTQRTNLIKNWTSSAPAERDEVWQKIQAWNQGRPTPAQLNKGDLLKALQGQMAPGQARSSVENVRVNSRNRAAAASAADLYQ